MKNKALNLLKKSKSTEERAGQYAKRIKKSLRLKMLDPLEEKINKIDDEIYDLENFTLDADLNREEKKMTKEECEKRFEKIINLKYEKQMLALEFKVKKEAFVSLFGKDSASKEEADA